MIFLLSTIINAITNILPTDPLQEYLKSNVTKLSILPYLNWIVPFDICLTITRIWVPCIVAYFIYRIVKDIIFDFIINKIFD